MSEPNGGNRSNFVIFLGSFLTIFANGVGFSIRGAILGDWSAQFGFTKGELGSITGGGLWGFGLIIILSSLFLDRVGYKPMMVLAFIAHVLSAVITLIATPVFHAAGKDAAYFCLYGGLFLFAIANGLCEGVVNPLVATLYPKQKTHYLNILHASWPGGLIVGGLIAYFYAGTTAQSAHVRWEYLLAIFLVPVALYGVMILPRTLPKSEASAAGVSFARMLTPFLSPILLLLILLHAMVGYVELGTDSWITNIMNNVVASKALLLFVYTSALMFVLRFFAGPIVEKINPLGLLTLSAVLACGGLLFLSKVETVELAFVAATVYACGKTFFWPTMLGVAGERYPQGGALVMGALGGAGMLSAGLLGGPVIGYQQDSFASKKLEQSSTDTYQRYVAAEKKAVPGLTFLPPVAGLDGAKVAVLNDEGADLAQTVEILKKDNRYEKDESTKALVAWWETAKVNAAKDKPFVTEANLHGGREALKYTAIVPAMMAVLFFLLVLYFKARGGYKQVHLETAEKAPTSEF